MAKSARMPTFAKKDEHRVVVRPRGGLVVSATKMSTLRAAIITAANIKIEEAEDDSFAPNAAQNTIVLSTPSEARSFRYGSIQLGEVDNTDEWSAKLLAATEGAIEEIDAPEEIETMGPRQAHLLEARRSLQKRWRWQRPNRKLRKKIAELGREIERHSRQLCSQQWFALCSQADGQLHRGGAWKLLRQLMDEIMSCEYQRTRMAQILHTTVRQLGEEEMFKRLNERYLPIASREDHPDYAGQPNPPSRPRSRGMGRRKMIVYRLPKNMDPERDAGRRAARAVALARQHQKDEGAVYVDAARYPGRRNAFAAVVVSATTGKLLTASTVRTRTAGQAEEVVIALATVSPHNVSITDELGVEMQGTVGPFNDGDPLDLFCTAHGRPPPLLSWWQDARMLKNNESASTAEGEASGSVLHIDFLQRSQLMARIICKARSGEDEEEASIILDMNLRPLRVAIATPGTVLVAERAAHIRCDSWGSRPAANLSWWMGSRSMTRSVVNVDESSGHTSSLLAFTPGADDHGRRILCRATNERLPGSAIENALPLEVEFPPTVRLRLVGGSAVDEGREARFECSVKAHPQLLEPPRWLYEGRPFSAGRQHVASNGSLHVLTLHEVRRSQGGLYSCLAKNARGTALSASVRLQVRCENSSLSFRSRVLPR
ncbi:hypothetical protein MRX96_050378 [Rhipicephalus microplus]